MHDPVDCHRKAEALATLAEMFPDKADRYREMERHWRGEETRAVDRQRRGEGTMPARHVPSGE